MVFTWIVSLPTKNASLVDIVWGMGFALVALFVGMRAGADVYGEMKARVRVNLHPGVGHSTVPAMMANCVAWLREHG